MKWRTHIESKSEVLNGKLVVKGTRLSVDFLCGLITQGWTREQMLENYPELNAESLEAVHAYSEDSE